MTDIEILKDKMLPCLQNTEWEKAIRSAIKALETCEDCISRDMALEKMADYVASGYADSAEDFEEYSNIICQLPSVQPKTKIGHWIKSLDSYGNNHFTCSQCGNDIATKAGDWDDNYCSLCGSYNGGRKNET